MKLTRVLLHCWGALVVALQQVVVFDESLDAWALRQSLRCVEGILANIGQGNEVSPGVVVAGQSKEHPDYWYQWTRDLALVMRTLISVVEGGGNSSILGIVSEYVENQYHLQRLTTLSGLFDDLSGLGEPKFLVNNTAFNQSWGRPQRDGPALRVIAIGAYFDHIEFDQAKTIYNDIVKYDLQYVIDYWQLTGFDLWEEIDGNHFYTSLVQLSALELGGKLATTYGDDELTGKLKTAYDQLEEYIWKTYPRNGVLLETPSEYDLGKRKGTDVAVLLASLHTHVYNTSVPFDANSFFVTNSLGKLVLEMKLLYSINQNRFRGTAIGRYKEDIYDGYLESQGNPWFLATAACAEVLYRFVYNQLKLGEGVVVRKGDWLEQFVGQTTVEPGTRQATILANALFTYADDFLDVVKEHSGAQGLLSEQFNRNTGFMQGCLDLTWSYAAVWLALQWRQRAQQVITDIAKL